MKPGVYFAMPMDEYRAIDAVGSSALRDMLISPLDCWARHVNPERREPEDTAATLRGTAFHAMLLEGAETFHARYYPQFDRSAYSSGVLWSGEDLATACGEKGLAKNGTLLQRAEKLAAAGVPLARLGPLIEADYEAKHEGRIELPRDDWNRIITAYAVMEQAGIARAFSGGFPEVTIVYECDLTGLLRKARIDYLKPQAAFDLKTFSNIAGKELHTAVAHAFIFGRQHVQAVDYWHAIERAKQLGLPFVNRPEGWAWSGEERQHDYFMLYRQAGEVPNVAVRRVCRKSADGVINAYWRAADDDRRIALKEYKRHLEAFGTERPWIKDVPVVDFDDTEMPGYLIGA